MFLTPSLSLLKLKIIESDNYIFEDPATIKLYLMMEMMMMIYYNNCDYATLLYYYTCTRR